MHSAQFIISKDNLGKVLDRFSDSEIQRVEENSFYSDYFTVEIITNKYNAKSLVLECIGGDTNKLRSFA